MKYWLLAPTLLFLITVSGVGQAQTVFQYGAEAGLSVSQLPRHNLYLPTPNNDRVTVNTTPLYSPLLGLTTQLLIKKHLLLSLAVQYQMTGEHDHSHRLGNDLLYGGTYRYDLWEDQIFHKLCMPLSAGYAFTLWGIQPSLFVGYRPNYFLAGKHTRKSVFDHDIASKDNTSETGFNPLDTREAGWPVNRFQRQMLCGIAAGVGQHLKISLTLCSGGEILYSESALSCLPYGLRNDDYSLTIIYLLSAGNEKH